MSEVLLKNYLPAELAAQLLSSCDFVGDNGCTDPTCEKCHTAPPRPPPPQAYETPAAKVVLNRLKEECAEVIQAISKLERFGPKPSPYSKKGNQVELEKEVGQVLQLMTELAVLGVVDLRQVKQQARHYAERLAAEPHWIAPHVVHVPQDTCKHQYLEQDDLMCPSCHTVMVQP